MAKNERPKPPSVMDDLPSIGDRLRSILKEERREGSLIDITPKSEKTWVEAMVGVDPRVAREAIPADRWVCWGKDCAGHFTSGGPQARCKEVSRAECRCAQQAMRD